MYMYRYVLHNTRFVDRDTGVHYRNVNRIIRATTPLLCPRAFPSRSHFRFATNSSVEENFILRNKLHGPSVNNRANNSTIVMLGRIKRGSKGRGRGDLRHNCKYGGHPSVFPTSDDNCPPERTREGFVKPEVKSHGSKCHGARCS